jgi:hypothetical protein
MYAVSPLQMCFRTPTAGSRPPLLAQLRSCTAEVAILPTNARASKVQERGASAPRGCPPRPCGGDRRHNVGSLLGRDHAMDCVLHRELTSSADFSTAGDTTRWIADYGRLARRISPELARPCEGLRAAGQATASPDFSTAGDTMRRIADYRRLARRISPRLARPSEGLRAAGEASASPDLSTVGETVRLIAEDTLGGIMAINGDECAECVGRCRLGGNAEHSADGAPPRNV